jgi:hypothetical protein
MSTIIRLTMFEYGYSVLCYVYVFDLEKPFKCKQINENLRMIRAVSVRCRSLSNL